MSFNELYPIVKEPTSCFFLLKICSILNPHNFFGRTLVINKLGVLYVFHHRLRSRAGNLGRFLNIPMTDAMIQRKPEIAAYYKMIGQPTINYPQEVDHLEAMDAVRRYHPWTVVASWVTQLYKTNFEDAPIHYDRSAMGCQ